MKISGALILLLAVLIVPLPAWALQDSQNPEDWYARAQADWEVAELTLENTSHFGIVCFLSHQAVEKSLKGALLSHGFTPKKTHLNRDLISELSRFDPKVSELTEDARVLDTLYVSSRYPKPGLLWSREKAEDCLERGEKLIEHLGVARQALGAGAGKT